MAKINIRVIGEPGRISKTVEADLVASETRKIIVEFKKENLAKIIKNVEVVSEDFVQGVNFVEILTDSTAENYITWHY